MRTDSRKDEQRFRLLPRQRKALRLLGQQGAAGQGIRQPLTAERLGDAESQLRDGQLSVAEFVAVVAGSDLFQNRLDRLAPLRGAAAAYLALLGRAAQPAEASRYLAARVRSGQQAAVRLVLDNPEYASSFGQDTVPYLRGLQTADGIPLTTVNRTASLYGGNAALNPAPRGAI